MKVGSAKIIRIDRGRVVLKEIVIAEGLECRVFAILKGLYQKTVLLFGLLGRFQCSTDNNSVKSDARSSRVSP